MTAPEFAKDHADARVALAKAVALVARQEWSKVDRNRIGESWLTLLPRLLIALIGGQRAAAGMADPYTGQAMAAAGLADLAMGTIQAAGFAGAAADGRSLLSLLFQPVITALTAISKGASADDALALGAQQLETICRSEVADAGRAADQVAIIARPSAEGYTRVAVGETCARCLILAGRWYPYSEWFLRHPLCDCIMLPAQQAEAAGLVQDPMAIYDSLTAKQRTEAGWNKAEQEAIDEGSDINQVTNARRGVYTAGGRQYTTEGTTRAGLFGGFDVDPDTGKLKRRTKGSKRKPRLTPEQIYQDARDRDEAIQLLQENGYLLAPARASARPETKAPERAEVAPAPKAVPKAKPEKERDSAQAKRERQQKIDVLIGKARRVAELWELLLNDAEADSIRRDMNQMKLGEDLALAPLLHADLEEQDAFRIALGEAAERLGLEPIGGDRIVRIRNRYGDFDTERTTFDRTRHELLADNGQIPVGAHVDVVRPGFLADIDGKQTRLMKAIVITASNAEIVSERPMPGRGATGNPFHLPSRDEQDLAAIASEKPATRLRLSGGQSGAETELVTLSDGRTAVHKRGMEWGTPEEVAESIKTQADAEQLAALLGQALGAPVARVFRNEADTVWMEFIHGADLDWPDELIDTPAAIRIGLLDVLSANGDRNPGNLLMKDGQPVGIDHAYAWGQHILDENRDRPQISGEQDRPSRHFITADRGWNPNPLTAHDVTVIRQRLEALRADFAHIGREEWLDYSLSILAVLASHAAGTERMYA